MKIELNQVKVKEWLTEFNKIPEKMKCPGCREIFIGAKALIDHYDECSD